jgi:hypothetical protein
MNSLCLAYLYSGKRAQALPLCKATLEGRKVTLGATNQHTLESMNNLALAYHLNGKTPQALSLYKDTVELSKVALGPEHRDTLLSMGNMAATHNAAGQRDLGLPLLEETVRRMKDKYPNDPATMFNMSLLAQAYQTAGKLDIAIPLFEEVVSLETTNLGSSQRYTLETMNDLVECLKLQKNFPAAETWMRDRLGRIRQRPGPQSAACADALTELGQFLFERQEWVKAETVMRECLEIREKIQPDDWRLFNTRSMLGAALFGQRKCADAEPFLLSGYEGMKERANKLPNADTLKSPRECLARLYESTDRAEQAGALRQEAVAAEQKRLVAEEEKIRERLKNLRSRVPVNETQLDSTLVSLTQNLIDQRKYADAEVVAKESLALREKNMPDKWFTSNTRSVLGEILVAQKKLSEAEPHLLAGYDGLKQQEVKLPAAGKVSLRNAVDRLVQFYEGTNQPEQAADWKKKLAELTNP